MNPEQQNLSIYPSIYLSLPSDNQHSNCESPISRSFPQEEGILKPETRKSSTGKSEHVTHSTSISAEKPNNGLMQNKLQILKLFVFESLPTNP